MRIRKPATRVSENTDAHAPERVRQGSVGGRIKTLRKEKGINAETLAFEAGVSPATIYRHESSGGDEIKIGTLKRIAAILGVSVCDLLDDAPHTPHDD